MWSAVRGTVRISKGVAHMINNSLSRGLLSGRAVRMACLCGVSVAAIAAGVLAASPAAAQAAADTSASAGTIETVVVTARKKSEDLQSVPLSITALTAEQLTATSSTSIADIANLTPGLTFNGAGAQANESPVIRGLSDTSGGEATSSNVSIFLDGVYIANPSAIDLSLGGLARVEVVKGPVSGLYGRNAFTGAINYVTAPPTNEFHTDDAVTFGSDGRRIVEVGASGPIISDVLTGRFAGTYDHIDGTFKDPVSGVYGNGHDRLDFLASLNYTPDEHISITPVVYYGNDIFTSPVDVTYAQNCAIGTSNSYCGDLGKNQIGPFLASNVGANVTGLTRHVVHVHDDNKFTYSFGTIDVLLGYNDIKTMSITEFDGTELGTTYALYLPGHNNPFAGNPTVGTVHAKNFFGDQASERDTSVEARYDTPQDERFRVSLGGYYYFHIGTNNNTFGIDGTNIPAGTVLNFIAQNYVTTHGQSAALLNFARTRTEDYSGFAGFEFDILPNLTASGLIRYTSETQGQKSTACVSCNATFDSVTSNSSLTWKPTDRITAYISVANGEKSGGFNGAALGPADATFSPEKDWNYEIGAKTTLLDDHLKLNADVFHTDVSALQVIGPPSTAGAIGLVVKNFGSLSADGFELESEYVDDSGINIGGGLAYTDPRFNAGSNDFSDGAACALIPSCAASRLVTVGGHSAVNLNGLAPPFESDWTFNATFGYHHALSILPGFDWFFRADYRYESKQYNTVDNFAYYGPRNNINLHAGVESENWTFTAYVLNLGNDKTPVTNLFNGTLNGFDAPPVGVYGVNWIPTSELPDGRTYAFRLAYHF